MPGFSSRSTSQPRPSLSMVPALKFSMTTSAFLTISMNSSLPLGCLRSRVTPFLQRSTNMKYGLWPLMRGGNMRVMSPHRGSIFMTSAPMAPMYMVHMGPAWA